MAISTQAILPVKFTYMCTLIDHMLCLLARYVNKEVILQKKMPAMHYLATELGQ